MSYTPQQVFDYFRFPQDPARGPAPIQGSDWLTYVPASLDNLSFPPDPTSSGNPVPGSVVRRSLEPYHPPKDWELKIDVLKDSNGREYLGVAAYGTGAWNPAFKKLMNTLKFVPHFAGELSLVPLHIPTDDPNLVMGYWRLHYATVQEVKGSKKVVLYWALNEKAKREIFDEYAVTCWLW